MKTAILLGVFAGLVAGFVGFRPREAKPAPVAARTDPGPLRDRVAALTHELDATERALKELRRAPAATPVAKERTVEDRLGSVDWAKLAKSTLGQKLRPEEQEAAWAAMREIAEECEKRFGHEYAGRILSIPHLLRARNKAMENDAAVDAAIEKSMAALTAKVEALRIRATEIPNERKLWLLQVENEYLHGLRRELPSLSLPRYYSFVDMSRAGVDGIDACRDETIKYWTRTAGLAPADAAKLVGPAQEYAVALKALDADGRQGLDTTGTLALVVKLQKQIAGLLENDPVRRKIVLEGEPLHISLDLVVTTYATDNWLK